MTIHKCQGLTLSKAWIDLGSSERTLGIIYVALSRVKKIQDLVIEPVTLERLQAVKKLTNFKFRLEEEKRLDLLANETLKLHFTMSYNTFFVPLDTISKQLKLVIHSSQNVSLVRDQNKKILISCSCSNRWQIMWANLSRFIFFFGEQQMLCAKK